MVTHDVEHVRARIKELAERAKREQGLQRQLSTDPAAALRAAGLPEDAVTEYATVLGRSTGDVAGYLADPCGKYYTENSPCFGDRYTA